MGSPSQSNLALAAALLISAGPVNTARAEFKSPIPGYQQPKPGDLKPNGLIKDARTATLKINNPLGFTIQEKKGNTWETLGRGNSYTKTFRLLGVGTSITPNYRIIDPNDQSKSVFYHSTGALNAEMYPRNTYEVRLGHQGFESEYRICAPEDNRCRTFGRLRSINQLSAEISILPTPEKRGVKLGQAMAFKGNTSNSAIETALCSQRPLMLTYLPYLEGKIGGTNANGSSSSFLLSGTSERALSDWCNRTFPSSSGFISRQLSLSEMIALVAGGASTYFQRSSLRGMPAPVPSIPWLRRQAEQGVPYWQSGNTYKHFIYDSQSKSFSQITSFNATAREKLEETFRDSNKTLITVRNIYPSNETQLITLVDLSGLITGINAISGSISANSMGSEWWVRIGGKKSNVDIGKTTRTIDSDYKGMTIDNSPTITVSDARLTSPASNQFTLRFKISISQITGEVYNDGGPDWDYKINSGTVEIEVPFALEKRGQSLIVKQLKNCKTENCVTSTTGFGFSLTGAVASTFQDYVINRGGITSQIRGTVAGSIGENVQASVDPITNKEFALPSINPIPGINQNPLEYFLGIDKDIIPSLHIDAVNKKIKLAYKPQVPFITPIFMRQVLPIVNITYP